MTQKFQDQGGAASSSPSAFKRWLGSKVVTKITRLDRRDKVRRRRETKRAKEGRPHTVEYFHQVDDGYSHLAAQVLKPMLANYDIELICHLVPGPQGDNSAEPELLLELSRRDSHLIAEHYNLSFPEHQGALAQENLETAQSILANLSNTDKIEQLPKVGQALWSDDKNTLASLAQQLGQASPEATQACINNGLKRRTTLKHYSGGMFYYEGEWYWGVDRLHHLEKRLTDLGLRHTNAADVAPRQVIEAGPKKDKGSLTLEIYPSLRSPYTSIIFDTAVKLARDSGIRLKIRPVLPMVMRGVPATREKGLYIFSDCVREAHELGVPYGNFYDPIGEPVRQAYSLYPWACEEGKDVEFISAFLSCAFAEGINTNSRHGMKTVVEKAGLDWRIAKDKIGLPGWEEHLEDNRLAMYSFGCWGVPCFRLLNQKGEEELALWGQDRLWVIAKKIQELLSAH